MKKTISYKRVALVLGLNNTYKDSRSISTPMVSIRCLSGIDLFIESSLTILFIKFSCRFIYISK